MGTHRARGPGPIERSGWAVRVGGGTPWWVRAVMRSELSRPESPDPAFQERTPPPPLTAAGTKTHRQGCRCHAQAGPGGDALGVEPAGKPRPSSSKTPPREFFRAAEDCAIGRPTSPTSSLAACLAGCAWTRLILPGCPWRTRGIFYPSAFLTGSVGRGVVRSSQEPCPPRADVVWSGRCWEKRGEGKGRVADPKDRS